MGKEGYGKVERKYWGRWATGKLRGKIGKGGTGKLRGKIGEGGVRES